jgi:hypothetical protein
MQQIKPPFPDSFDAMQLPTGGRGGQGTAPCSASLHMQDCTPPSAPANSIAAVPSRKLPAMTTGLAAKKHTSSAEAAMARRKGLAIVR